MEVSQKITGAAIIGCAIGLAPVEGLAHGSMESPISRVYRCYKEGPEVPKSDACKAVVKAGGTQPLYDWMEVNQPNANSRHRAVVPDGTLCGGGRDKYIGLDLPRKDWRKTTIVPDAKGRYTFVFYATTPHATKYFRFFITRNGWKRTKPLAWSDLRAVKTIRSPTAKNNRYTMRFRLPSGTAGPHVIYAIQQRSDSTEAFYSCSDVKVVQPAAAATTGETASWSEAGEVIANNALTPGSTVSFRAFNERGGDVEAHTITVNENTGAAARWPFVLAKKVNTASAIFRIGVADESANGLSFTPVREAAGNLVYLSGAYPGYRYQIDIDTPVR